MISLVHCNMYSHLTHTLILEVVSLKCNVGPSGIWDITIPFGFFLSSLITMQSVYPLSRAFTIIFFKSWSCLLKNSVLGIVAASCLQNTCKQRVSECQYMSTYAIRLTCNLLTSVTWTTFNDQAVTNRCQTTDIQQLVKVSHGKNLTGVSIYWHVALDWQPAKVGYASSAATSINIQWSCSPVIRFLYSPIKLQHQHFCHVPQ